MKIPVVGLIACFSAGQEPPAPGSLQVTREGEGAIRVVAPGRFETTFTKRKGFGATWHDLARDPLKQRDLAPVLDENGFFWVKIGRPGEDASWYSNPPEEMKLLEAGPARARVQVRGPHMRYGSPLPKAAWSELRFDQTFTLYPDGSVHVAYVLETPQALPFRHFLVITKSNGAWGPNGKGEGKGEVRIAGEGGPLKPTAQAPTAFTLQWADGPTHFTDILMVARQGRFPAAYWNEGYLDKDIRCSFDLAGLWPDRTLPAGKTRLHFLVRLAAEINSAQAGALHAEDYRSSDRLEVSQGRLDTEDEGDRDGDGYNEDQGCYVLRAASGGAAFRLHGSARRRVNPAFKIKEWAGTQEPAARAGGKLLAIGKDFTAGVQEGALIVQFLGTFGEDVDMTLTGRSR